MNTKIAASSSPTTHRDLTGLVLLFLLVTLLVSLHPAAAASGTVSVTIRVEVGMPDLLRGGDPASLATTDGTRAVLEAYAPTLRRGLERRYSPAEVDRIVNEVSDHSVVIFDDAAIATGTQDAAIIGLGQGRAYSI